jgi:hypothetical protein
VKGIIMSRSERFVRGTLAGLLALAGVATVVAQQPRTAGSLGEVGDVTRSWTTADDHKNMMAQLGITKLRPGPSGNESAPNHANYDEALANPYPNLPDVMTLKNGQKVTSAAMWGQRRREIVEDFDREVLGRVPKDVPRVTWTVAETAKGMVGDRPVVGKVLVGHVDNSSYPAITVDIQMTLVTPADAKGPVPVMMMFGGGTTIPGGTQPARGGRAGGAPRAGGPPPAGAGAAPAGAGRAFGAPAGAGRGAGLDAQPSTPPTAPAAPPDPPATQQLIAAGWGYAQISPGSIQADNGAGLTKGIIGLVNEGAPRKPDDWGSLRAWAWGASRGLDYLESDKTADATRVGIEGVSRYGRRRS